MKIGIFDSGLGGLLITQSIVKALPHYDYVYLGDTKRVPYGNRSASAILEFTLEAVNYLFSQNCQLIIIACNTASAEALRIIQQKHLAEGKKVLGVLIPTVEEAVEKGKVIGVIATAGTVNSKTYEKEIVKLKSDAVVIQKATPLLVPLIENDGLRWVEPILKDYLESLQNCDTIILGCTHYPLLKNDVRKMTKATVISQDEIVAKSLEKYLERHAEIASRLSKNGSREYYVTDLSESFKDVVNNLIGEPLDIKQINL